MNNSKAVGPDNIPVEVWQGLGEKDTTYQMTHTTVTHDCEVQEHVE